MAGERPSYCMTRREGALCIPPGLRYDETLHEIRTRVRTLGARLVQRWVRVRKELREEAAGLLRRWRANSTRLLGVHLRGTDKVTC